MQLGLNYHYQVEPTDSSQPFLCLTIKQKKIYQLHMAIESENMI